MVPIATGDNVPENDDLIVVGESGDYADLDLILCAKKDAQNFPIAMYQAQFLRYGSLVYQFETPEALGAAISAIEPGSTHDAAQLWREEEARRIARNEGTLQPENPTPAPDALEEKEEVPFKKEKIKITDVPPEEEPELPPVVEEPPVEVPPEEPIVPEPEVIPPVVEPDVPAVDLSTTTPE